MSHWDKRSVPMLYIFCYRKIKDECKGNIVGTPELKAIIKRFVRKLEMPRTNNAAKVVPKDYIYNIIKDMGEMELLERIDHTKFRILQSKCEKKLKVYPW